jgi:hypothetical protein
MMTPSVRTERNRGSGEQPVAIRAMTRVAGDLTAASAPG